jgi:predicted Zn-dependent protease
MSTRHLAVSIALTMLLATAQAQTKRRSADDPDQKELYDYALTMDKVQRIDAATKGLEELSKKHPEVKDSSDAKSLSEIAQKFEKYPDAVAVLAKNNMTPREYAVGMLTLMQAGMAVGMKKSGTYKEYPPEMLKVVSKPNLDFVEQHWDTIQKMQTRAGDDK